MFSFRRFALVLALSLPAAQFALAQTSSSTSGADQQNQAPPAAKQPDQGALTVQGRIRARREARRAAAIKEVYSHRYELSAGMGYLRFQPGANLQRTTYYAWNAEVSRFYSQRLGITLDGRGYYGTAFVGLNQATNSSITRPAISTYTVMGGPVYRFYMQPKYSISGRVMGGYAMGNFSGDTNGFGSKLLGLYPDGGTYAANAGLPLEYNVSPAFSLRIAPEFMLTGFGSSSQKSVGFTAGFVLRVGKQ